MTPLVSIAMPSFNQAQYIEAAIESVFGQSYANIELIVSDGGSTDDTPDILARIGSKEPRLRWVSEPDDGPADAISKSFSKARGEIIGWLNSDDLYASEAVASMVSGFQDHPDWLMCYGRGEHVDETGQSIALYPTQTPDVGLKGFEGGSFICQPTVFLKVSALTLLGNLDRRLKTAFDYDYWIRAFRAFPNRIGFLEQVVAKSRLHSDCITQTMRATVALEGLALSQRHLGRAQPHWAATYLEELEEEIGDDQAALARETGAFLEQAAAYLTPSDLQQIRWATQQASGS
ncbi:MAG: glycosyltransferase [Henriciella sp.]|nr:glycosyltransferase [Henriciella sp.]